MVHQRKLKDIGAIVLIVIGLLLVAYPTGRGLYQDARQKAILKSYMESVGSIENRDGGQEEDGEIGTGKMRAEGLAPDNAPNNQQMVEGENQKGFMENDEKSEDINKEWPVEAVLEIKKIDLLMPIIKGATKAHLNVSAASMDYTGKPWEGGNYVVVGHSSQRRGNHFGRLVELKKGDEITVRDQEGRVYTYKVSYKKVVDEEDISVLEGEEENELTLITCYPAHIKDPPTRLVVKARPIN